MNPKPESTTPSDFPRDYGQGAIGGAQPKLLVRKIGDTFVQGLTEEERYARYDACFDMVKQLAAYCHRKLLERPEWSPKELLEKVRTSVEARADWDFSPGEVNS